MTLGAKLATSFAFFFFFPQQNGGLSLVKPFEMEVGDGSW